MVAAAIAGGVAVAGIAGSAISSSSAAGAAKNAAALQQQQFNQTQVNLSPYRDIGEEVLPQLGAVATENLTGGGTDYVGMAAANMPGTMTEDQLRATPGYQFALDQGLQATQSAAAARGLGVSGAALKGAATFATGLADQTYTDQFNKQQQVFTNYLNLNTGQQGQLTNQYNRLIGTAGLGANAAATTATNGQQAANAAGGYISAGGQAGAAGALGVTNSLSNAGNSYIQNQMLQQALASRGGVYGGGNADGLAYGAAVNGNPNAYGPGY